ncbi:hypothetical protein [Bdellovibrio sp. HCB337]|uniref:hypothetical protein n=1 Tax=Bdellovibrio sp. HCB337 TaxID=3394358 RepID=UPI0039A7809E
MSQNPNTRVNKGPAFSDIFSVNRPTEVLGKILGAFVRSLFFSGVMFVIFFSIVTGGFPPDFSKLSRAFNNLQAMSKMSKEPLSVPAVVVDNSGSVDNDEKDIAALEAYNKKRAELGEGLFGSNSPEDIIASRTVSSEKQDDLKTQMRDLQQEIFRLQQRVSELEEQVKEKQ